MSYFNDLVNCFAKIETRERKNKSIVFSKAVDKIINKINRLNGKFNKIIFIGNGGSASIASHIATDFLKNTKIPSFAFNDACLLTCLSNDFGYENVFQKPIEIFANEGDVLFAVSSSGKSKNILNATQKAFDKGCYLITLTGFGQDNPLRFMGDINFYIPSYSYGHVEISHLAICHYIVDRIQK